MLVAPSPERDGAQRRERADEHVADAHGQAGPGVAFLVTAEPYGALAQAPASPEQLEHEQRQEAGDGIDEEVRHEELQARPKRKAERALALAASCSRFLGTACVSSESTRRRVTEAISWTA